LQQFAVFQAGMGGALGEVFAESQVRVRVRLQHIELPLRRQTKVHAGITAEVEHLIDSLREPVEMLGRAVGQVLGGSDLPLPRISSPILHWLLPD